jgi:hypothetical protein
MLMNAMSAWYEQIDWVQGLEYASGTIAATGILWQTSIWLSVFFVQ